MGGRLARVYTCVRGVRLIATTCCTHAMPNVASRLMIVVPGLPDLLSHAMNSTMHSSVRRKARVASVRAGPCPASSRQWSATVLTKLAQSATQTPFAASKRSPSQAQPYSKRS